MKSYEILVDEDRRLVILRCLNEDPGYSLNESVLQTMLHALGHRVSRDRLLNDLAWLTEQGLITVEDVMGVQVARISSRGIDAAMGAVIVPGVKRPRP